MVNKVTPSKIFLIYQNLIERKTDVNDVKYCNVYIYVYTS